MKSVWRLMSIAGLLLGTFGGGLPTAAAQAIGAQGDDARAILDALDAAVDLAELLGQATPVSTVENSSETPLSEPVLGPAAPSSPVQTSPAGGEQNGAQPTLTSPSVGAVAQIPALATGLTDFLRSPTAWALSVFNAALVGLIRSTSTDIVSLMGFLLGNGNVISQTPPSLSYEHDAVKRMWGNMRFVGNGLLAAVTAFGGLNIIVRPHLGSPYHRALELIPRVLVAAILVNTSLDWGRFTIDANNLLCQSFGTDAIPAWQVALSQRVSTALLDMVIVLIYFVMGILLLLQMLMRLALVDVLLIVAPLAAVCWVLPQTSGWARVWATTFFGTVFAQFLQVLVLQLGGELVRSIPGMVGAALTNAPDDGRLWLVSLLLSVAVMQLARTVPRLMPGYFGGGNAGLSRFVGVNQAVAALGGRRGAASPVSLLAALGRNATRRPGGA